jgi:hypothetical protein
VVAPVSVSNVKVAPATSINVLNGNLSGNAIASGNRTSVVAPVTAPIKTIVGKIGVLSGGGHGCGCN